MPYRNGKGLSHGLKTCHWHVFLTPFRVPPFLLEVAVRQKGLVTLRCCRRRAGGKQQSTGLLHLNFRVPYIWNTKTVYPGWDTPETRCFHSIHTPTGRVWNGKGLSHGLKTVHRTVFTAAALPPPFRVPPFLLEVAVRQKGLVTLRCCRRRAGGKQQSTGLLHFIVRVPFIENTKTVYPGWDTPFLVRVFLWDFSKNAVIPTVFWIAC